MHVDWRLSQKLNDAIRMIENNTCVRFWDIRSAGQSDYYVTFRQRRRYNLSLFINQYTCVLSNKRMMNMYMYVNYRNSSFSDCCKNFQNVNLTYITF